MPRLLALVTMLALIGTACGDSGADDAEIEALNARIIELEQELAAARAATSTMATVPTTTLAPTSTSVTSTATAVTTTVITTTTTESPAVTVTSVLDDSDPRADGVLNGNAAPPLGAGDDGELGVVAIGAASDSFGSDIFIVVRNNTGVPVKGVEVTVTVRDRDGGLVGTGSSLDSFPYRVLEGSIAVSAISLRDVELEGDEQFEFLIETSDLDDQRDTRIDAGIDEHAQRSETIVAVVNNPSGQPLELVKAGVMCFSEAGEPLAFSTSFVEADEITPSGTSPVSLRLRGVRCPVYLIGAHGFEVS